MANSLVYIVLVTFFCGLVVGTRTKLSIKLQSGVSAAADGGICKSMVQPQGYECEEHTVIRVYNISIYIVVKI